MRYRKREKTLKFHSAFQLTMHSARQCNQMKNSCVPIWFFTIIHTNIAMHVAILFSFSRIISLEKFLFIFFFQRSSWHFSPHVWRYFHHSLFIHLFMFLCAVSTVVFSNSVHSGVKSNILYIFLFKLSHEVKFMRLPWHWCASVYGCTCIVRVLFECCAFY